MDKLDEDVVKSAKRLAELRPEKYGATYDTEFSTYYLAKEDENIVYWEEGKWVGNDLVNHLDQMLADEGMFVREIWNMCNSYADVYFVISNMLKDLYSSQDTTIHFVKNIPALKQTMLKEVFVKFVELLESK